MTAHAGGPGAPASTPGGPVDGRPGVLAVDLGPGVRAGFTVRAPSGASGTGGGTPLVGTVRGNLGLGVGDDPERVLARRRTLAAWAGVPLAWVTQVHGTGVLDRPAVPGTGDGSPVGEADAVVVGRGAGAAVVAADCVPVLLADPEAGVGAAVHAGRRGLVDGVVQATLAAMLHAGARAAHVRAAIGPAICGRCYEVPAEMRDRVAEVVPAVATRTSWGTPALDLPAGVAAVLAEAGVTAVHSTGWCTHTDERFFSHRRSVRTGEMPGRCAGVVALPGSPGRAPITGDTGRVGPGW